MEENKGMEVNNTNINKTSLSPFYNSAEKTVNPFLPVYMHENSFSGDSKASKKRG